MKLEKGKIASLFTGVMLKHPVLVTLVALFASLFSVLYAAINLEFRTARSDLIASGERHKRLDQEYSREFKDPAHQVVVVIQSDRPERAKAFASALAKRWEADKTNIESVFYRVNLDALKKKALLYLSDDDLLALKEKLQKHQDLLRELAASPSLQSLFALINREITLGLVGHVFTDFLEEDEGKEAVDLGLLVSILEQMNMRLDGRHSYRSPWETFFMKEKWKSSEDGFLWSEDKRLLFVFVNPRAEAGSFNRFKGAVEKIRGDIQEVGGDYPDLEVGVTGRAVLESDEMAAAQRDTGVATLISLVGVTLLFIVGFRGIVRPLLANATLAIGLCWSLGFTALTIGHLNILSIVFMPLLIGLGIDYAIYFVSRYEEERAAGQDVRVALERTFSGTGPGITATALTTAFTFSMLLPTKFRGLAELGFITGSGLLLILLATFTALPALLVLHERRRSGSYHGLRREPSSYLEGVYRRPWVTLSVSAFLASLSLLVSGRVGSDFNLLHLQAEGIESVTWEYKILESAKRSAIFGEVVAKSLDEVKQKEKALRALPSVGGVESVTSLIPEDQERKLPLIRSLRPLLDGVSLQQANPHPLDLDALLPILDRIKFKMLEDSEEAWDPEKRPPLEEMREVRRLIGQFVETVGRMGKAEASKALLTFQTELFRDLGEKFAILKGNLKGRPVTIEDLPSKIRERFVGKTGKYRLLVFPAENAWELDSLGRFVGDLRRVDPDALGVPVMNFEYMRAMKQAYEKAGLYALVGVLLIALLIFRDFWFTLLASVPLVVGSIWTLGLMVLFHVKFNFANLLLLPLIVAPGIESGIMAVYRYREESGKSRAFFVLPKSTGKGIALSCLSTMVGFGSLMISSHRGIFSLGLLITLGVGSVLVASLTALPSFLMILSRRARGK